MSGLLTAFINSPIVRKFYERCLHYAPDIKEILDKLLKIWFPENETRKPKKIDPPSPPKPETYDAYGRFKQPVGVERLREVVLRFLNRDDKRKQREGPKLKFLVEKQSGYSGSKLNGLFGRQSGYSAYSWYKDGVPGLKKPL